MKFIFPKNYNYKMKILGFINYSTAILDAILALILFGIVNLIFRSLSMKIYFFIGLYLPIFLFSIFGVNKESIISVIKYIVKFIKNRKVYLYGNER